MDILSIRGLSKRFGDREVLKNVNLTVPDHSIFGFIGKNGAGKTTTMKTVLGLVAANGGRIEVCGEEVRYGRSSTNRLIGYLPDVPEFYPFMTGEEYLHFCGRVTKMEADDYRAQAATLLDLVGLGDEKHRIKGYSRGMKQRLGIAQALLNRPRLLICDEPTSALDPVGRREILSILQSIKDRTTVLFSTHILSDVEKICTDVAFLHEGEVRLAGRMEEIKEKYNKHEYILEVEKEGDFEKLSGLFPKMKEHGPLRVCFSDRDYDLFTVMKALADKSIGVERLEKAELDLETLFMEVVGS